MQTQGSAQQFLETLTRAGIAPHPVVLAKMTPASARCKPQFAQGGLSVEDDPRTVGEFDFEHRPLA
jgi:hypothetical protein